MESMNWIDWRDFPVKSANTSTLEVVDVLGWNIVGGRPSGLRLITSLGEEIVDLPGLYIRLDEESLRCFTSLWVQRVERLKSAHLEAVSKGGEQ